MVWYLELETAAARIWDRMRTQPLQETHRYTPDDITETTLVLSLCADRLSSENSKFVQRFFAQTDQNDPFLVKIYFIQYNISFEEHHQNCREKPERISKVSLITDVEASSLPMKRAWAMSTYSRNNTVYGTLHGQCNKSCPNFALNNISNVIKIELKFATSSHGVYASVLGVVMCTNDVWNRKSLIVIRWGDAMR